MFGDRAPKLSVEQDAIRELFARKQSLLLELNNYHGNMRFKEQHNQTDQAVGMIPARTRLQTSLDVNAGTKFKRVKDEYNFFVSGRR